MPRSSTNSESAGNLKDWLTTRFQENGGAIPFEQFMADALYHPDFGYYTHHIRTVGGSRGDFATSPTLNRLLGEAIAEWIAAESERLNLEAPIHVIEAGGGEGSLMRDVLVALDRKAVGSGRWKRWLGRRDHRFHLVEISPRLRERQKETLCRYRRRVTWHETIESALERAKGTALIFSNELVDAFPTVALRREADETWSEVFVCFDPERGVGETYCSLNESRPELDPGQFSSLQREAHEWEDGQRIELHESFRIWQQNWAPHWKRGAMLTVDYGSEDALDIYHRRVSGTLRAYFRHQRLTGAGLYRLFGQQDITADVCFGDLIRWGEALGWETVELRSQAAFLRDYAPGACAEAEQTDRSAAFLFEPDGAGEAFCVLTQRKPDLIDN